MVSFVPSPITLSATRGWCRLFLTVYHSISVARFEGERAPMVSNHYGTSAPFAFH